MPSKKGAGGKAGSSKKQTPIVPDSDHIVFGDDKKKKRGKTSAPEEEPGPSKPTARQVVGGASWTGKLPVNLLSEHCQRQKWNRPDYSMRQIPAREGGEILYRSEVTLSKTDPKTKEVTKIPAFRLSPSDVHLADQPSALEARHFAATYALFRVQSMKNLHMTLPPTFRDLWKGDFTRMKKEDNESGHGWKYDEDPFAAETKRQEILKSMEKRKEGDKKKQENASKNGGSVVESRAGADGKIWERAPKAEMGQQIRIDIEQIVRQRAVWNQFKITLSRQQREQIVANCVKLGFRKSHVEEALDHCKDRQEALEWLLVHVPEDDLPKWTFPPNYSAGVTLASGDIVKEAKLKSLASAGYPQDLCVQALRNSGGDENSAAFYLQNILVQPREELRLADSGSSPAWEEEMQTLEAIFGANFRFAHQKCSVEMSTTTGLPFKSYFRCPTVGYPYQTTPALSIEVAGIPAYIRLSAIKRATQYAQNQLLGEVMIYSICQWLEAELPGIIEDPGRLSELRLLSSGTLSTAEMQSDRKGKLVVGNPRPSRVPAQQKQDRRSDLEVLEAWHTRQTTKQQIDMLAKRQILPAWSKRDEIVQAIANQKVTIVSGETGSGKSTQVVQFVLDHAINQSNGSKTNILCTQPRRVAAISLADRVSSERCSNVGDEVGYIIRGESKTSISTKITFMTTGVLLRRLQSFNSMKEALMNVSHVFIDEVHERSLDTDFLLALLRDCMKALPRLKIVLMSATLDANIFTEYFGGPKEVALTNIEGRTFPVQDIYLEDVFSLIDPHARNEDIGKTIQSLGFGINYDLIRDTVQHIDRELKNQTGAILIFLPGTMEIERCLRAIADVPGILGLPLHASLLPAEQRKVFPPAPPGRRKVVAATNVAETSITIEDIAAVIDTGRVKETNYDAVNNIVRLEEVWASQAACKQRRGRAGRVRAGICYKLFTRSTDSKMHPKTLPEIQRVPLEQLCLSVKATGVDRDVSAFLARTLTPPNGGAVSNAIKALHVMGALEDGQLTALGTYLAMIPADLRCAKLLVYGTLFDCLEPCLTIASILTVKSPFVSPRDKRDEANEARSTFSSGHGDLMLDLAAYEEWAGLSQRLRQREVQDWCSQGFLSSQVLRDISSTRRQILDSLKDAGLVPLQYRSSVLTESTTNDVQQALLLRALVAASLQPQVALISFPSKKYISSMSGAKELDPEAKTIKFFIPDESSNEVDATPIGGQSGWSGSDTSDVAGLGNVGSRDRLPPLTRVFVHPSSSLFTAQTFSGHATHLSYFTKMMTTKLFIRDLTPLNIYGLLLFGGNLELDTSGHGLVVGNAWRIRGWARIGVLISRLRVLLDEELRKTVEEGGGSLLGSMSNSEIVKVVRKLIVLNGQDQ